MKERVGDGKLIGLIISTTVSGTNDRIVLQIRAQGPDLQNILRQSYDYLTTVPKLRSTHDGRLFTQHLTMNGKLFIGTVRFTCKIVISSEIVFVN